MDKEGQSEVTNKLRSAIKKKLSKISDFVDDELPEYIMILVANQRSKSQIEKDLSLFLREDTANFTNWLWGLLNNINIGSESSQSSVSKIDSILSKRKDDVDADAILLNCDNESLCLEDTNDSNLSKSSVQSNPSAVAEEVFKETSVLKTRLSNKTNIVLDEVKSLVRRSPTIILEEAFNETFKTRESLKVPEKNKKLPEKKTQIFSVRNPKEPLSSKIVPVRKKLLDYEDGYDPSKPNYVSKPYKSVQRNYGGPAALQANKLLLKAVDDATKSILVGQSIEEFYKPTPIKVLTSKRFHKSFPPRGDGSSLKSKEPSEIIPKLDFNSDVSQASGLNEQECSDIFMNETCMNAPVSSNNSRTICLRTIPLVSDSPQSESMEYSPKNTSEYLCPAVEEVSPKSPHFIVTLEGVNLSSFKRKLDDNSVDSMEDEEEETTLIDEFDEDTSPNKKLKVTERCKYWPACKNSDHCLYHHPTSSCKRFPDCKYGDKCLYIHPNCKFDALCSRKECPFTHASKRKLSLTTVPVKMDPVKSRKAKALCKFYPNCTMKYCAFIHPKLCRYGTDCRLPMCSFSHFPLPSRSQLKWQAA